MIKFSVSCRPCFLAYFILFSSFVRAQHDIHLLAEPAKQEQDSRNNQFDVQHYTINLSIINTGAGNIQGNCAIDIHSKMDGLHHISLDLLALNIDSVFVNEISTSHIYNDTLVEINLPGAFSSGQDFTVRIVYHGHPVTDASGWGGYYSNSSYAFNLGVGFEADPHTYGRVWFPCVDDFTDRATYDFFITTASNNKAFCNGLLQQEIHNANNTTTWHWKLDQTIPTYLASFAIADYASVETKFSTLSGDSVPVILAARSSDTTKLKNSFVHLPEAFKGFEERYGPYRFDRVGFVLVQFSSGAMEHATNIAYPRLLVDGTLQYESLMAHEFSHHWWGDLVTCSRAEDMWLNEGWATYSEMIFFEKVYGTERYHKEVRINHTNVLQYTHIKDHGFRAVSGVPHDYTYGSTVYDKGADVAHSLRGYLGDDLFFQCIQDYLNAYQFNGASSEDFRDFLSSCSGIDLTDFFNNWVFHPGFPHFSIDSFQVAISSTGYNVSVNLRQRLKAAPEYYKNVPLSLTFFSANEDTITKLVLMSGSCGIYYTELPFEPVYIAVDLDEKISDAITDKLMVINSTGNYDFEEAFMEIDVSELSSKALVRVEHNWIAPDPFKNPIPGLQISTERYWKVDGIFPDDFKASGIILYNGTNSLSGGYLDNNLLSNSEDSLVVLYRATVGEDWSLADSFRIIKGISAIDRKGEAMIYHLKKGEYALGIYDFDKVDSAAVIPDEPCIILSSRQKVIENNPLDFNINPNPANDSFQIEFSSPAKAEIKIRVFDFSGKMIEEGVIEKNARAKWIKTNGWTKGFYLVNTQMGTTKGSRKLVVIN